MSRANSSHFVIIDTGAPTAAMAHYAVRPIARICVWGRQPERATATAVAIRSLGNSEIEVIVPVSIEAAVATADIVSCSNSSSTPVLASSDEIILFKSLGTLIEDLATGRLIVAAAVAR